MINVNMTVLIDIYSDLLTEKQKISMELYYNEDYTLAEIADHLGISRQGVHENIKQGTEKIKKYESVLCLKDKGDELKKLVSETKKAVLSGDEKTVICLLEKLEDLF